MYIGGGCAEGRGEEAVAAAAPTALPPRPSLTDLPHDTLLQCLMHLPPQAVAALAATCRRFSGVAATPQYWEAHMGRCMECTDRVGVPPLALCRAVAARLKALRATSACEGGAYAAYCHEQHNIVDAAIGCSSQDQEDEAPINTLQPSRCYRDMLRTHSNSVVDLSKLQASPAAATPAPTVTAIPPLPSGAAVRCQTRCGCSLGRPCYWSSSGSDKGCAEDHISYSLKGDVSVVTSLAVTPYQAFWQPDSPAYAPASARLAFYHPSLGEAPYYTSEAFGVMPAMRLQTFELAKPAIFLGGGEARLELTGRQQRQTLGPDAGAFHDHYYTCLSFVGIYGASLASDLCFDARAQQPLRITRKVFVTVRGGRSTVCAAMTQCALLGPLLSNYARHAGGGAAMHFVDACGRDVAADSTPAAVGGSAGRVVITAIPCDEL